MGKLSKRIENLAESQTIAMARMSRELQEQGVDVISLSLGEPDFLTPENIRNDAKAAIDDGFTHYPPISGYNDLRQAIADKFKRENGFDYSMKNIVVSTGAKQSLANAILSMVDPGDEVVVPVPYWVSYSQMISLAEGKPVFVPSSVENDYKMTAEQLEAAITDKTRLLVFSSPCNPSGTVYTKAELESFAEVLDKHPDIMVLSDEIYEHINFVGKHESIAQFDNVRDRVVLVNGVSKGYAMMGWRIGYMAAPAWIIKAVTKLQGQFTSGAGTVGQMAAVTALTGDQGPTEEMKKAFRRRRDLVLGHLETINDVRCSVPDGAFYVFPDMSAYFGKSVDGREIKDSFDLCMYLLESGHIATVPGAAFGAPDGIRISFANSDENLEKAMERLKNALAKLS